MNLERYRSSFSIFVAISDVHLGGEVAQQLTMAGYNCERRLNYQSLNDEIHRNPPHIIIMFYEDKNFFPDDDYYRELLEALGHVLPETQIIFLCKPENLGKCSSLYEVGIYDCLPWPPSPAIHLLRAVERACETNYYMYLNEHLREELGKGLRVRSFDPALYQVWLKELDATSTQDECIRLFLREAARYLQIKEGLYFRYREVHHTLVLTQSVGIDVNTFDGVGIDLAEHEPGFVPALLHKPHLLFSLQEFVKKGLLRQQAVILPLIYRSQVLGVFVLPEDKDKAIRQSEEDSYLGTCLLAMRRQFEICELNKRLERLSVYDYESEAYQSEVINGKLREEVVRARRILHPVSILLLKIDGFADMTLAQTPETTRLFLKAFHEIIRNTSRVHDLIGRAGLDEFLVCLPHTSFVGATIKAERIRRTIESADFSAILGTQSAITASVGVSEYPRFCHDAQDLVKTAETALVEVTRAERNRVGVATAPARFVPDFVVKNDSAVSPAAG